MHRLVRFVITLALIASVVTWVGAAHGATAQGQVYTDSMDSSATGLLSSESPDPARFVYGYQNNQFIIQVLEQGWSGDLLSFANVPSMPDVSVKIDFSIAGDLTGKYAFVGCRLGETDTAYMFEVHPDTAQANIWRFDGDDAVNLATVTDPSAITIGSADNTIEIRCQGSTITGIANGRQVLSVQDSTYSSGDPFLGTGKNNATTDTLLTGFDNLVITDLGGTAVQATQAPAQPTQAPVQPTQAPVQPTQAPIQPTTQAPPVEPTTGNTGTTGTTSGDIPMVPYTDPAIDPAGTLDDAFFMSLSQDPLYESDGASGNLSSASPQYLDSGVNLTDFYAELYYLTPPTDPAGLWTFGFCFWADADGHCYDLFVSSNGATMNWGLGHWSPSGFELVQSGPLPAEAIDLTPGAENEMTVAVYKGIAMLSSNTFELDASFAVPGQPYGGGLKGSTSFIASVQGDTRTLPVTVTYLGIWDMSSGVYPDFLSAPAEPTQAPLQPTQAPALPTQPPLQPTQAPVQPTQAPVQPTQPGVQPTLPSTTGTTAGDPALTQSFGTERAAAQASAPISSIPSGILTQLGDSFNVTTAGVSLTNVYAVATYINPTDMTANWDIGMGIRDLANDTEYRFVIRSDGAWVLTMGGATTIAEGNLTTFNAAPGGSNTIEIIAKGATGYIAFNGQALQQIDLSGNMNAGDVYIASGLYISSSVAGREVPFQNFAVYQIAA